MGTERGQRFRGYKVAAETGYKRVTMMINIWEHERSFKFDFGWDRCICMQPIDGGYLVQISPITLLGSVRSNMFL